MGKGDRGANAKEKLRANSPGLGTSELFIKIEYEAYVRLRLARRVHITFENHHFVKPKSLVPLCYTPTVINVR